MANYYTTANGKQVDYNQLLLKNEKAPALGNMNVNARGDKIDSSGNVIQTRNQLMKEYHKLDSNVPTDTPVVTSSKIKEDVVSPVPTTPSSSKPAKRK